MMYNEEQKRRYLDNCGNEESTIEIIEVLFNSVSKIEISNNKDICEFNLSEVLDLLKSTNSKSRQYLMTMCYTFEKYYDWCLRNGIISDVNNKYATFNTSPIIKKLIPDEAISGKFFSRKVLIMDILPKLTDVINRYIVYSIFLGIHGKDFEELRNIKPNDLDRKTQEVSLITGRKVKVDTIWIKLMEAANEEEVLVDGTKSAIRDDLKMFADSPYVLKLTVRGGTNCMSVSVIRHRFSDTISKQTENEFITPKNIYFNGMINYVKERYAEKGITIQEALLEKNENYIYRDEETQQYIYEFGARNQVRTVRMLIKPHIKNYMY